MTMVPDDDDPRIAGLQREQFVAMVAHELRSPVQALLLHLDATLRLSDGHARDPEWFRARAAKGIDRVRHMAELLDRFLDLTRVGEGRVDLAIEEMDLVAAVRDVLRAMADELRWAGCVADLRAPERIAGAWDRPRLHTIVTNLVGNARKYGAGRPITVTLAADEREARIVVTDHGPGVPVDQQARIFERFERLAGSGTPRVSGMGLGLWIARQLVVAHGGTIGVANRAGAGAEFTVALPLRPG